jgi:2-polyprenyl-3-methyl-5-hydroxy-6-metoxy-1,4-benzoquinol methylase
MTYEPQYEEMIEFVNNFGVSSLGIHTSIGWEEDPKRLLFHLSRYKFVSKMFSGFDRVLEIGCGDGFASRIVRQSVNSLDALDIDPTFIEDAISRNRSRWNISFSIHDILANPWDKSDYDGIFLLDVFEHFPRHQEDILVSNIVSSLRGDGVVIIGIPSLESQNYASPRSIAGHVNCKSGEELRTTLLKFFKRVLIFSMNDEVVHTGFYPLAHYLFAVCTSPLEGATK